MARTPTPDRNRSTARKRAVRGAVKEERVSMSRTPTPDRNRNTARKHAVRGAVKEEKEEKMEKMDEEKKVIICKDKNYMKEILGNTALDWEYAIYRIETVEVFSGRGPRRGFVYIKLLATFGGEYVRVPLRMAKHRFPLKLLSFYESHIDWKDEDP
ncbi:hypothetical protein PQX77_013446 [Marasmius sp. AFHP31]|nr:hypothetical protein PQX77_013446 [Marasmius sp. AFHP31]